MNLNLHNNVSFEKYEEMTISKTFYFCQPICGFESIKEYIIAKAENLETSLGYFRLNSLGENKVSFIAYIVPYSSLLPDIQAELEPFIKNFELSIQHTAVGYLVIIDKDKPKGERISLSRIAPLIFCFKENQAWQVILEK